MSGAADIRKAHVRDLLQAIQGHSKTKIKKHPLALPGQPFDSHLLSKSPHFLRSRKLYLKQGGKFEPAFLTSPRTLSSSALLGAKIQYSPLEDELIWVATDPIEKKSPLRREKHLLELITYTTSLFHEQNHRIVWKLLPPPPSDKGGLRRYLNFAESLVITLDMALGDQLGPKNARGFYLSGVTYDPGTTVRQEIKDPRAYRNYLQAALHSTYLHLELYNSENIRQGIEKMFPSLGAFAARASRRSGNLDTLFINLTNPDWQFKNRRTVLKELSRKREKPLQLSDDPGENWTQYLIAEKLFGLFDI